MTVLWNKTPIAASSKVLSWYLHQLTTFRFNECLFSERETVSINAGKTRDTEEDHTGRKAMAYAIKHIKICTHKLKLTAHALRNVGTEDLLHHRWLPTHVDQI